MTHPKVVLDEDDVRRTLVRIAHEIVEKNPDGTYPDGYRAELITGKIGKRAVWQPDVTLRDGLQLTSKMLPTERKVEIARELLSLGVPALEVGSMR